MKNPVKRSFYLGVCAAAMTKRFVDAEVKKYLAAGHITENEGKKIVDNTMKQLSKDKKHLEAVFLSAVKKGIKTANPIVYEATKLAENVAADLVKNARSAVTKAKKVIKKRKSLRKKAVKAKRKTVRRTVRRKKR
jgi:polyhydroxyalkanoate synthesis regulator phasin